MLEEPNTERHTSILNIATVYLFKRPLSIIARDETLHNQQYKTVGSKSSNGVATEQWGVSSCSLWYLWMLLIDCNKSIINNKESGFL